MQTLWTAAARTLPSVAYPEMRQRNYDQSFASGLLAVAGTLAIMIPPGLGLILFGAFAETSVGRLRVILLVVFPVLPTWLPSLIYG